jgi:hypothetical protein
LTGTMPTKAQFTTCEAQSNFGTLGGSAIGGSTSGSSAKIGGGSTSGGSTSGGSTSGGSTSGSSAKIGGGGLVPLTSGVAGPLFLGSK